MKKDASSDNKISTRQSQFLELQNWLEKSISKTVLAGGMAQVLLVLTEKQRKNILHEMKQETAMVSFNKLCLEYNDLHEELSSVSEKRLKASKYQKKIRRYNTLIKRIKKHPLYSPSTNKNQFKKS